VSAIFAPNPRGGPPMLLLASKDDGVRVMENPDESKESRVILDLKGPRFLCTNGERGLQAIAIHPKFNVEEGNYWIYLFYTERTPRCLLGSEHEDETVGPRNIVARFRMNPDTLMIDLESKQELWASPPGFGRNHNGGAMAFGVDGKLWLTCGDNNNVEAVQDLKNTLGTVIRINPEDGNIPVDNPFSRHNGYNSYRCSKYGGRVPPHAPEDAVCAEIFAYGFRNPFRITMDPTATDKVKFTIQDVGQDTWEEISEGGTDYAGRNYGWPTYEGVCKADSTVNCPKVEDSNMVEPYHWYMHRDRRYSTFFYGACITAAVSIPKGIWPPKYRYLFADFVFREVYHLMKNSKLECRTCVPPIPGTKNATFYQSPYAFDSHNFNGGRMTDLLFGPYNDTQALYVVQGGFDSVVRIRYTGSLNTPPLADFSVPYKNFEPGKVVQFTSTSADEDGDDLTFEWDFGDGSNSTAENPRHIYKKAGQYKVTLTVIDEADQAQESSQVIVVGQLPNATIVSPSEGDLFQVGQLLELQGYAIDSNGNDIPDSRIEWEVRQHHAGMLKRCLSFSLNCDFALHC
jgi:Glucose / Sorbosone dehydrogenase/PKD domain